MTKRWKTFLTSVKPKLLNLRDNGIYTNKNLLKLVKLNFKTLNRDRLKICKLRENRPKRDYLKTSSLRRVSYNSGIRFPA